MYRHILIATDGSDIAGKALLEGLDLAKALGARVTIVTVTEPMPSLVAAEAGVARPVEDYERAAAANADTVLGAAAADARTRGVACDVVHVKDRFPAEGIVETAKDRGGDLIVMATQGRSGLSKLLLGSQAAKVVSMSPVPVLVCR
jgi:nucleotide-binding universal stress UspA family protein